MISIITVNYNNDFGLSRTLRSLQEQDPKIKFEHIIIDGGSTDKSITVAKEYKSNSRNVSLRTEKDLGIYNAMNKGIKLATGSHIAFLNSGDILANGQVLTKIYSVIDEDRSLDFLYGNICFVNLEGSIVREWISGMFTRSKLYRGWMPPHPMTTIRTTLFRSIGNFDETLKISADYDLMLKILLRSNVKVKYLPYKFVHQEIGGTSNESIKSIFQANIEVLKSWTNIRGPFSPYWVFLMKPLSKILQLRKRP